MHSKVLDYIRPPRKNSGTVEERSDSPAAADPSQRAPSTNAPVQLAPMAQAIKVAETHRGPLDFPSITAWLMKCEEDFERGRDRHEYTKLSPMFAANGCTRIDDITRMLPEAIKSLAGEAGVNITVGLINRVHQYAVEDVARVKTEGRLS